MSMFNVLYDPIMVGLYPEYYDSFGNDQWDWELVDNGILWVVENVYLNDEGMSRIERRKRVLVKLPRPS